MILAMKSRLILLVGLMVMAMISCQKEVEFFNVPAGRWDPICDPSASIERLLFPATPVTGLM